MYLRCTEFEVHWKWRVTKYEKLELHMVLKASNVTNCCWKRNRNIIHEANRLPIHCSSQSAIDLLKLLPDRQKLVYNINSRKQKAEADTDYTRDLFYDGK